MTYWHQTVVEGLTLDLKHLEPFVFECFTPKEAKPDALKVNVRCSNHVFSEAFDEVQHAERHTIWDGKRKRAFSPERYDLSFRLPGLLASLPERKVYQTAAKRNYMYFEAMAELAGREYQIYFTLKKEKTRRADLDLFVESAYPSFKPAQRRRRPSTIRFSILALKIYQGQEVRFAPR